MGAAVSESTDGVDRSRLVEMKLLIPWPMDGQIAKHVRRPDIQSSPYPPSGSMSPLVTSTLEGRSVATCHDASQCCDVAHVSRFVASKPAKFFSVEDVYSGGVAVLNA